MIALALALLVALAVDHWWGEPRVRLHPVVWMGTYLGWAGAWVQRHAMQQPEQRDYKAFWLAAIAWIAGSGMVSGFAWGVQAALLALPWWAAGLGLGLALKPLLAWALLKSEVQAVEAALGESLPAARERLRWLVSRDVAMLTDTQVREGAIETLAENLNDSVVAPIFWFVLLGLPGAALYRFANTADAMWGYRGVRNGQVWEWGGKWAARADDCLSWVPARITAALLMLVSGCLSMGTLRQEARRTPSPNSGWPMAAMALGLGVCLHKPGIYALNAQGRCPQAADTQKAIKHASNTVLALVFIASLSMFIIAIGSCLWC